MKQLLILLVAALLFIGCGGSNDFADGGFGATGTGTTGTGGGTGGTATATTGGTGTATTGGTGTTTTGGTTGGGSLPSASDDNFTSIGNARITYPGNLGVLQNDTLNGASITTGSFNTSQGGSVTIAADGGFTYVPVTGFTGTDTFTYTLTNTTGTDQGTVSFNLPQLAHFVDNTASVGGDGTLDSPFTNFQAANQATSEGDVIFVFRGDGTATGLSNAGGSLKADVRVVGETLGLRNTDVDIVPAGARPFALLQLRPEENNFVGGFRFEVSGTNNHTIFTDQDSSLTISNNVFRAEGTSAVLIVDLDGDVLIEENTFECTGGNEPMIRFRHGVNITPSTNPGIATTLTLDGNSFTAVSGSGNIGDVLNISNARGLTLDVTLQDNLVNGFGNGSWNRYATFSRESIFPGQGYSTTVAMTGDVASSVRGEVLRVDHDQNGTLTMNLLNTQLTTTGSNAVGIFPSGTSQNRVSIASSTLTAATRPFLTEVIDSAGLNLQLLGSTFSNSTNPNALEVSGAGNANICLDATGNTFNSGLELDQSGTTTLGVEEDGNLSALNNSATINRTGIIGDLLNGACGSF